MTIGKVITRPFISLNAHIKRTVQRTIILIRFVEQLTKKKYFIFLRAGSVSNYVSALPQDSKVNVYDKVDSNETPDKTVWEANKMSPTLHVIGSLPIAEYEGSPRRYGLRTNENMIPTLLSSPSFAIPRPGFPQVRKQVRALSSGERFSLRSC